MKEAFKRTRFGFFMLYATACILALTGRISLVILDRMGAITYDYISASTGSVLSQLLTVFTGAQLYGCMAAMGLSCALFAAANILMAFYYGKYKPQTASVLLSFVWGLLTVVATLICTALIAGSVFSAVQVAAMKIKMPITMPLILAGLLTVLAVATLFTASVQIIYLCMAKFRSEKGTAVRILVSAFIWGLVSSVLAALTFRIFDLPVMDARKCGYMLLVDIAVNLAFALAANYMRKQAEHT